MSRDLLVVGAGLAGLVALAHNACSPQPAPPPVTTTTTLAASPTPSPAPTPCYVPATDDAWRPIDGRDTQLQVVIKELQQTPIAMTDRSMIEALRSLGYCAGRFQDGIIVERSHPEGAVGIVWEQHRPTASFGGWRSKTFCDECSLWVLK